MTKDNQLPLKRRKRKRKNGFGYIILFALVFILTLFGLSYLVKSFSPEVDVAIGNNDALTFADSDTEIKTVDERLKWIQMEDELPSVAIRTPKSKSDISIEHKKKKQDKNEIQREKDIKNEPVITKNTDYLSKSKDKEKLDFRLIKTDISDKSKEKQKNETTKVSKVYIGKFDTIEEAVNTQRKIASEEPETIPFIKSINGKYVVQVGSFSDEDKAHSLAKKMLSKGYKAKSITENK